MNIPTGAIARIAFSKVSLRGLLPVSLRGLLSVSLRGAKRRSNLFILLFIFFGICPARSTSPQVCHLNDCLTTEVVSKQADVQRGLMYRTGLDQNKGMLFVFTRDGLYQFWMKNMRFSLDILWISADGHIVFIGQNIPACRVDPCPVYAPDKAARYVLELNSGYTASHRWQVGDKLDLKGI